MAGDARNRLELWASFLSRIDARRVAAIGVFRGTFAQHLLDACPGLDTYFMVDPWRHLDGWNKPANKDGDTFEQFFEETMQRTQAHEAKRVVLRGISVDLHRVHPKVRDGGWIGGDDFSPTIRQHKPEFEPTMVFPFAVYFAEAVGSRFYGLPGASSCSGSDQRPASSSSTSPASTATSTCSAGSHRAQSLSASRALSEYGRQPCSASSIASPVRSS